MKTPSRRLPLLLALFAFLGAASLHAQRADILIYVMPPDGEATEEERDFFVENFEAELIGAGYGVAASAAESLYLLKLSVYPTEGDPTSRSITIALLRTSDEVELVTLGYPYKELTEMYQWTLYLIYSTLANVPAIETDNTPTTVIETVVEYVEVPVAGGDGGGDGKVDETWKHKWLYLDVYAGGILHVYDEGELVQWAGNENKPWRDAQSNQAPANLFPLVGVGLEFQFLNHLSLHVGAELTFQKIYDGGGWDSPMPSLLAMLKLPLKPGSYFMISPYLGAAYNIGGMALLTDPYPVVAAPLTLFGGVQYGVKTSRSGGFFLDFRFGGELTEDFGIPASYGQTVLGTGAEGYDKGWYHRVAASIALGYKFGYITKKSLHPDAARKPASSTAAKSGGSAPAKGSADPDQPDL